MIWEGDVVSLLNIRVRLAGRSGKVEGWKISGRIEKIWFFLMCLVGGVAKWEGGKFFCLVGEKNERMKNVVYIN